MIKCLTDSAYGKRLIWAADSEIVAHPGGDNKKGTVFVAGNSFCWVKPGPGAGAKPSWLPVTPLVKFHCLKVPAFKAGQWGGDCEWKPGGCGEHPTFKLQSSPEQTFFSGRRRNSEV